MTKISIIVPVYNVEQYLPKCLDSLVNQTFSDFEIIIVNDGTKDNSQKIIDGYVANYPDKIKSFITKNGGQASARNFALKQAKGEFITYVDSDDWVDIKMLEKIYSVAKKEKSDIVVFSAYSSENEKLRLMDDFSKVQDLKKDFILARPSAWCKLIKREILENKELSFLERHFYEDIAVVPALCLYAKKISFINEPLYFYLVRQGSTMNQKEYTNSLEDIFDSMNNLTNLFKKKKAFSKYKDELEYLYIEHLLHAATLRFLPYEEGKKSLQKIHNIMKNEFPNFKKNKYYKKKNLKFKIICTLIYLQKYGLLKKVLKIK